MLGGIPPPPPMGGIPPPPMMNGGLAPPAPPVNRPKSPGPANPALAKLGGKATQDVDLGQLLKSIQGGIKLKKAVTNDKSGLFVDEEMRGKSVTLVEPAPPPPMPDRGRSPMRPKSALGIDSEDERYATPVGREYRTPEPRDDSPEQTIGGRRPIVMHKKGQAPIKPDVGFDENSLKVSADQINSEIKKGTVASKMGAMAKLMGLSDDQVQGGTLPRATFRPSPLRSSFLEVNNNKDADGNPKPKPVSKWAPVDTNYGLRRASNNNCPTEKNQLTLNDPRKDRANSERRSYLDEPHSATDRARTQSPTRGATGVRKVEIEEEEEEVECEPTPAKKDEPKRLNGKRIPDPISVKTDFSRAKPEIQETPATPVKKSAYSYGRQRASSPSGENSTMASPLSSLSSTSPSVSPGSSSPDANSRRRDVTGASGRFDKAREKFGTAISSESTPTIPTPRPYFLKSGLSSTSSNTTPEHTDKETTPIANGSAKKQVSKTTTETKEDKGKAAEAKGASAAAKTGAEKRVVRKKSETAPSGTTNNTTTTTPKKPVSTTKTKPEEFVSTGEKPESAAPKPKRTLKKTMSKDGTVKKAAGTTGAGTTAAGSSLREAQKNAAKFDNEVEAVKRAVKEAAAARQRQYPSSYTSTNYTSSLYSPSSVTSSPLSRRRVIDVPISAPWHSSSSSLGRSMSETMNGFNRRVSQPPWVLEEGKSSPPK
ncbi:hypothetical protein WR25_11583 isoform B [Diploscapter pachys]|uniref:WH2 domain-containing protein n=1 Tax=Diploscapter pachys TaxID=2018661 RepID=A0A2A2L0E6_9BILA|nr:hypothetical protein WR25_11583 isoform B [Diploscapter pachys]